MKQVHIVTHPLECLANYAINNSICYHGYSVYALIIIFSLPQATIFSNLEFCLILPNHLLAFTIPFLSCFHTVFPKGAGVFYLKEVTLKVSRILSTSEKSGSGHVHQDPIIKSDWLEPAIQHAAASSSALLWSTATCSSPSPYSQLVLCGSALQGLSM